VYTIPVRSDLVTDICKLVQCKQHALHHHHHQIQVVAGKNVATVLTVMLGRVITSITQLEVF